MKEIIDTCPWLISLAEEACHSCGVTPLILPIRGGTDGAQLSFMGLPCPNLGTGGHAYHGPYEHITAEGMDAAVNVTLEIIRLITGLFQQFAILSVLAAFVFKSLHFQRPDIIKKYSQILRLEICRNKSVSIFFCASCVHFEFCTE